jgi:glycosyltransferase involved in cell wall biosynthesis
MSTAHQDHLLIFEPESRGHPLEWLVHLLRYASGHRLPIAITLAIPRELVDRLDGWGGRMPGLRFQPLSEREERLCMHRNLSVSGMARWWVMRRHMRRAQAGWGLALGIDHLSLPLALGFGFSGGRMAGILFRPSTHYPELFQGEESLGERLRNLRKRILYRLMLVNPALVRVLSLDPYFLRYANGPRSGKLLALPDPAPEPACRRDTNGRSATMLPQGRMVMLLFGVLTERKGLVPLLKALAMLPPEAASGMAVLLAGRVDPPMRETVETLRRQVEAARPELWLRIDDRELPEADLAALVDGADVVLAPYQRFVGSSGVLLWAARAGKPVITQSYGLLGQYVRDYGLGLVCDTIDPGALAACMMLALEQGAAGLADPQGMASFVRERTPENFAATIFAQIAGAAPCAQMQDTD